MEDFAKALEQEDCQFQKGQIISGTVFSHDSNGAYVDIRGKSSAFMPIDEASLRPFNDLTDLLPLNTVQEFLIIREQNEEGQLTLSRRQLEIRQLWDKLIEMNDAKQTVVVKVTGSNKGGITVDVMGIRGFIPRSHLLIREDLDALKGKLLTVGFLEVNLETRKLVLSEKMATRSVSFSQLERGQLIEGKISNIKPFGVFVEFSGTTGLLHINQISKTFISSLQDLFQIGQTIKAVILDLDEGKGRISLSTKVLESFPGEMTQQMAEVMATAEARAQKVQKTIVEGNVAE